MIINILSLGKFKLNQQYKSIFEYYRRRISVKTCLVELKTHKYKDKKSLEKFEILKYIKDEDFILTLDRGGEDITSLKLSRIIKNKLDDGCKRISFIIGSEEGFDDYFKSSFRNIAFGNQTWPHLLVRVMLIEQIYRSFEIIKNSQYHK